MHVSGLRDNRIGVVLQKTGGGSHVECDVVCALGLWGGRPEEGGTCEVRSTICFIDVSKRIMLTLRQ